MINDSMYDRVIEGCTCILRIVVEMFAIPVESSAVEGRYFELLGFINIV